MIVGVAGRNGAGKGEVIKLLEAQGFCALSLSDVIRDVLRARGLEESRERMIETGRELRAEGGPGVLGEQLLAAMKDGVDYAVDSVRHPAEVEALRRGTGGQAFVLLWVDADEAIRFERIKARGRSGDPETLPALRELEGRELGSADPAAQQLEAVRSLADRALDNDSGLDALSRALDAALTAA
ncbi:MAG: AAA family ATPase [bacterium]|nr:AAA family ATPase [bacterium]MCP5044372.1 AAA family ATPase [bacterium]